MPVKNKKSITTDASTQRYLPFSQIRDNVVLMKDNSARVVLKCSTINFLLKSNEEQDAIIISFQRFLNSIDFPIQILVRSSKLDIDTYLAKLDHLALNQTNSLLQRQTYEYIWYLKKLIEYAQIMKKDFYLVVWVDEVSDETIRDLSFVWKLKQFWASINSKDDIIKVRSQIRSLNKTKKKLLERVNWVRTWLESMWIKATELNKQDLVKFLADYYNPKMESFNPIKTDITNYDLI